MRKAWLEGKDREIFHFATTVVGLLERWKSSEAAKRAMTNCERCPLEEKQKICYFRDQKKTKYNAVF